MTRQERRGVRRDAIARAAWAVLMREGLRGASVRAVIAESGMSSGAMRYYFGNHDELLIFAAEHVLDQATSRITSHLANEGLAGRERVRAILAEILPVDATRAMEITVFARLAEIDDDQGRGSRVRASAYQGCRALVELAVAEFEQARSGRSGHAVGTVQDDQRQHLIERYHLALDGLAYQYVLNPRLLSFHDVEACLDRLIDSLEAEVLGS